MTRRGNGESSMYFAEKSQRWVGAVSLDDGKRKVVYGKSRQEAAKKLTAALKQKDAGLPFVNERLTVASWLNYWLTAIITPQRAPTTAAMYEIMVRKHIGPYLGAYRLAKLTPELVERWQRQLANEGASLETRRSAMVRLRTALNLAVKRGHVARNVAALVERPRVPRPKQAPPSVSGLRRLLSVIRAIGSKRWSTWLWVRAYGVPRCSACGGKTLTSTPAPSRFIAGLTGWAMGSGW
jgi:integrase